MAWSRALAYPIRAGIAAARGDSSRAATLFALAVTQLEAVDMNLYLFNDGGPSSDHPDSPGPNPRGHCRHDLDLPSSVTSGIANVEYPGRLADHNSLLRFMALYAIN